ncbi:MAG: ATP-binding protein [bacterium]|nr:ATP-binding protein [bacterium]
MKKDELKILIKEIESDRVERKESISDKDKICQAICAFANDLPNHQKPGYIFIGVKDNGVMSNLTVTDEMLRELADIRSDGNILPFPVMNVQKHTFEEKDVAVVEVSPSQTPPVQYKGCVWIRVCPSRRRATPEEERRLAEKRISGNLPFDTQPVLGATADDISTGLFQNEYLPYAVAPEILEANQRTVFEQMTSVRFLQKPDGLPTVAGILVAGKDPQYWFPGAYVQFLRIEGKELTDAIKDQKEITGVLSQQLRALNELIRLNISIALEIPDTSPDIKIPDYPVNAIVQIICNAVMHRSYEGTNAPVRIHWFSNRIEIQNPGGLYGQVSPENFRSTTAYRNPRIAEAMKVLGFVQRFGIGIQIADKELDRNGNPPLEFQFEPEYVQVTIRKRP